MSYGGQSLELTLHLLEFFEALVRGVIVRNEGNGQQLHWQTRQRLFTHGVSLVDRSKALLSWVEESHFEKGVATPLDLTFERLNGCSVLGHGHFGRVRQRPPSSLHTFSLDLLSERVLTDLLVELLSVLSVAALLLFGFFLCALPLRLCPDEMHHH